MWDETQSRWLLSPFPLPAAEVPKIIRAPGVVFNPSSSPHPPSLTPLQSEQQLTPAVALHPLVSPPHSLSPTTRAESQSDPFSAGQMCAVVMVHSARSLSSPSTSSDTPISPSSAEVPLAVQPLHFKVEVSSFGIVPDLRVRCKGSYLEVSTSRQAAQGSSASCQRAHANTHAFEVRDLARVGLLFLVLVKIMSATQA